MKKSSQADKIAKKRQVWLARTMEILALDAATAERLLSLERRQSVRINTLKTPPGKLPEWIGPAYSWMPEGHKLNVAVSQIRDEPLVASGQVFIQNAASWLPVLALSPQLGETILDICAAPGGKTSHIAAATNNQAEVWANDNSRPRLAKLQANMERLGVDIVQYTLYDATQLSRKLEGQLFNKILLDAPCSGEGLMNFTSDKDLATWSVAHIKRLQQLQKRLITQAWQLLKPGGTLVYSTCTMAPEENEAVVDYLLRKCDDAATQPIVLDLPNKTPALAGWNGKVFNPALSGALRLKPSVDIEAFFVCRLVKQQ